MVWQGSLIPHKEWWSVIKLTRLGTNRTILWRLKTILGFIRSDLSDFLQKSPHTKSACGMKKLQISGQKLPWVTAGGSLEVIVDTTQV
jgi:hypothetical protein